jgi:hypothetical protein
VSVSDDSLRCGRLLIEGRTLRYAAVELKEEISGLGVRPPFVHALVVVWGDFQLRRWDEKDVAYVSGGERLDWLSKRPTELSPERLRALRDAVRELANRDDPSFGAKQVQLEASA